MSGLFVNQKLEIFYSLRYTQFYKTLEINLDTLVCQGYLNKPPTLS